MIPSTTTPPPPDDDSLPGVCALTFNANDPSGAGGLSADIMAIASMGVHALPVVTGAYARDTAEIVDHFPLDDEAVTEQARAALEDIAVQVFKVGFVGSPENVSAIAELASDYADVPLVLYMPNLGWWQEDRADLYQDACSELLLPLTTLLVGNHSTLSRWLLPDWEQERAPSARDIAMAANAQGVPYTLVTGIALPDQYVENTLATANTVICSSKIERFEAVFTGAGDTLSAALAALVASGTELSESVNEALNYLDNCLEGGFQPGMGQVLPDRLFWARDDGNEDDDESNETSSFEIAPNDTRH